MSAGDARIATPLFGEDALLSALERALRRAEIGDVEIVYEGGVRHHTRFASSQIHQGIVDRGERVSVRVALGRRVGSATTGGLGDDDVDTAIARAIRAARATPEDPHFPGFPAPAACVRLAATSFDEETAALGIDAKAAVLGRAFDDAARTGVSLAGRFHTFAEELAVASTRGVRAYHASTRADVAFFGDAGHGATGYAGDLSRAAGRVDLEALAARATERALAARAPIAIEPGAYDVVLEPAAVAEVLEWMALVCFTARSAEDGSSFTADGLGRRVTGPRVRLYDDGASEHPQALPLPFDIEGVPKQRLELLDRGIAAGIAHDSRSAARAGTQSTGHATEDPLTGERLAMPAHLFLEGGDEPAAALVSRVERGIYVTRFHYVCGTLDPRRASMTGMTRDGTFLIESGRVSRPVGNLRWTESVLGAFERIDGLSRERRALPGFIGHSVTVAPHLLVRGWQFTGRQEEA
jgi:predicted Zn-dependent protease